MLAIIASPRKNGKIATMFATAVEKGKAAGYEVTEVNLYEKNIKYCTGCMVCRNNGVCVLKDDMVEISKELKESDYIVLAAPTYFGGVPAPMKALFDRIAGLFMGENKFQMPVGRMRKEQKYLLMTCCTTPFPFDRICNQSRGCIHAMKEVMHVSGMTMAGKVIIAGTKNKKEVPEKALRKIKRLIK